MSTTSAGKATRQAFGEALAKLGEKHPEIVVLDADLAKSTKSELFAKKFPDRFFEMGIAEMNMAGTAAGLAFAGKIPFACSFACFLTGRYDTIRLSVAYSQANVRLVGTHAGLGIGDDGHSQMGLEDIALMRALPTMGVFQPMDARETELLMEFLVRDWKGPAYIRLTRQNLPDFFPANATFKPGKLMEIYRSGSGKPEVVMIATGAGVAEAVYAAKKLELEPKGGVSCAVWNAHSLKPFDSETTKKIVGGARLVVTVEDHSVIGGLGSCVAEALAELTEHPKLMKVGCQDLFGESGEPAELYEKHGLSANQIQKHVLAALGHPGAV
jgi:transketolase